MRFNWKRVLSLVMALALIISFVPHNALHSHAEETEEPEVEAQASTTLPKGQSPEQVAGDGLTWVMDGDYYKDCGVLLEHTHGDGCVYAECPHYQRDLTGQPIHDKNTCYGESTVDWRVCDPSDGHEHTATETGYSVYANSELRSVWQPIYAAAEAEYRANNPKPSGFLAGLKYEAAVLEYAANAVKNTTFCYLQTAPLTCGHGDTCTADCCSRDEHTHIDPDCYAANWKEVADINNNEVADSQETLTITFVNDDGTVLQTLGVAVGEVPAYTGETPVKAADAQYTYTFGGWDKEIVAAMADATYTAVYTTVTNEYTVTFLDEDGTELWSGKVAYGETPTCAAPSKEGYRFAGWTPAVNAVTGDITYTATYTKDAAQIGDVTYASLADAIAAVQNGETIVLLGDCAENVTINQVKDKSFTIDGAGKTYTGTITVNGKHTGGAKNRTDKLTIQNINFVLEGQYQSGIDTVKGSYAHNITVDNCTFTGKNNEQYGIRLRNVHDVTVTNSTGTKLYDMVYGQYSVNGFVVENVTVTESNLGFWLPYATGNISFNTVTVATSGTAITFNNNNVFNVVLTNCNISGLRMNQTAAKSGNMSVKLVGNNIISRDNWLEIGDQKDNVITVDLSESTGNQTIGNVSFDATYYGICNTETEKVYQIKKGVNVAKIGEDKYFTTLEAAVEAAAYDDTIVVLTDIDLGASGIIINGTKAEPKKITIDLNGNHMIVSNGVTISAYQYSHVTLVNGTVKGNSNGGGSLRVHSGSASYESGTLVLGEGLNVICGAFGTGVFAKTGVLEVNGATVNAGEKNGKAIVIEDAAAVITSGTIVGSITLTGKGSVQISGGWFTEKPEAEWVVDGRTAVYVGSEEMWTITNEYIIKFVNEKGIELASFNLAEGEMPVAPEVEAREFYTFKWDPTIVAATENVTYTLVWIPNNDTNTNGVADEEETVTVTVVGNGTVNGNAETFTVVYDSTKETTVSIKAVPVIENGTSKSFVSSVAANGAELALSYADYCVTLDAPVAGNTEIVVTFAECGFVLDEDGKMRFYVGMEDPDYETLYNAIIVSPEYTTEFVGKNVKYLARTEGEYDIDLSAIRDLLGEIKYVGSLAVKAFDAAYPEAKTSITLEEKWLNVGDPFEEGNVEEAVEEAINEGIEEIKALIEAGDYIKVLSAIAELGTGVAEKVGNIGCHAFGKNTLTDTEGNVQEIISVVYDNGAMRLTDDTLVVTLVDDRIETVINAEDITVVYRDYTAEELVAAIAPELFDVDGNSVAGDVVLSSKVKGTEIVGTFEVTFEYKGSYDYKPATKTVVVTVEKAPASIDIPNVQVTYGEAYNVDPTVTLGNQYGDPAELTDSLIQFVVGLDISEFDYNNDGVKGLNTKVQLMLPAEIQELLDTVLGLTGNDTSNGMEMSLSELMNYLDLIPDTSLDSLNQALEAITSVVEAGDLTIVIGGELPTNVGAYLYGAVSTSGNYETAFDVAYIVIAPTLKEVYLDWNYTDTNGIFTWELLKHVDLGATAFDDAAFTTVNETATAAMQNLFFGVDENGELVIVLHGKNTELEALEASLGNGAYAQLAFTLDLGNELVYAVPIARAVVIVPGVANVEIVDAEGNALDAFTFTFDKTAKQLYVMVDGELVECEIIYTGVQTNVTVVEPTTNAPVHAGAYAAVATYIGRDANGEIVAVGIDAAALVIEPAQSTIEVTGGSFEHDGEAHGVTVVAPADVTLISGTVTFDAAGDGLGIEDVQGVLNVDFPKWLDKILSEKFADAYANGVSAKSFLFKLEQHKAAMLELGITEEIIDTLADLLKKLPDNVVVYFNDNVAYTEPGAYAYVGIVTDSDYLPSYDTGLVVIGKEDMVVDMLDTTVTYNGKGQFVNIYNPNNSDYVAIIIDRENNIGNIILEDDLSHLVTLLEKGLGRELPKTINVAELMAAIDKALTELEGAELPADAAAILTQVRKVLSKLPQSGVVYINGEWLPTDVGEYEFYGAAYALYYTTNLTEAVLTIVPAQITVTLEDKNVHIGDDMPELTYTVAGLVEGETLAVTASCEAENTETAGEFNITATYVENKNYTVTVVDATLTVEDHVEGEVVVEKEVAPDCVNTGSYDNVVYCTVCGEELSRETVTVPALGHTDGEVVVEKEVAPDCVNAGSYDNVIYCTICGEELSRETVTVSALGHTEEIIPAVEPTFDNVGWTEGVKCSVCGETLVAPQEIAKLIAVAQNKETGVRYETLAEAIAEVKNGQTIVILAEELDEDVTIAQKKNLAFTIDGAGVQYTGTITVTGSASTAGLTVRSVNFIVDGYGIYSYEKKVAYNITVDGCTFTGTDGENLDYGMYLQYVNNVTVKNTTGRNLFDLVYGNSSFTGFTAENVTVTDSENGIMLGYVNSTATFKNVTTDVRDDGVIIRNNTSGSVYFEDCNIDNVCYWQINDTKTLKMYFNDATNNLVISKGYEKLTVVLNKVDATVTADKGLNAVSGVDGYIVVHENGVYYLAKPVAQNVQTGKMYAELSKAIAEVENGETIIMLVDIDEDVTIKQVKNVAFTIDGANHAYSGTMNVTAGGTANSGLTVKNVNFTVDGYGIYSYEKKLTYNITVDGCTFTGTDGENLDYGMYLQYVNNVTVKNTTGRNLFDLVYGNSSFTGFTAENVTVTDSENGIMLGYVNSTATFKNVTTDVRDDGVIIRNNTSGSVYFEDCNIDNVCYWQINDTKTLKMYFNDATNNLVISKGYEKLTVVLNKVDATVTADKGLNAVSGVDGYVVAYKDGYYYLAKPVASVNGTLYGSIQDAVNAANDGDIVIVERSHDIDCNVNPLVLVSGKNITIDLNGKVVTANVTNKNVNKVFETTEGAKLTVKDDAGNGKVIANGEGILHYMFRNAGEMVIESGNFELSAVNGGAMFFSTNSDMTVNGGTFAQYTEGWMFNTLGNGNGNVITVNAGTFNRYFIGGAEHNENPYGEVVLAEGKHLTDNGNGTWTVENHKIVTLEGHPATCTTDGLTEGKKCEGCGEILVEQTVIKAEGHKPADAVKENEVAPVDGKPGSYDMVVYCSVCGEKLSTESFVDYGDYVCYNVETGLYYNDACTAMTEAVSGQTVKMIANDVTGNGMLWAQVGTNLDLNGYTVEAGYVFFVNGTNLYDSSAANTGLLKVNPNNIYLSVTNNMMPVWNPAAGGYVFDGTYIMDNEYGRGMTKKDDGTVEIRFSVFFDNLSVEKLLCDGNGAEDNNLTVTVRLTWQTNDGPMSQVLTYNKDQVNAAMVNPSKAAFLITLSNFAELDSLTAQVEIVSNTLVVHKGTQVFKIN